MGSPGFNPERASSILAEAEYMGDKPTAERWGITDRTIRNYRKRLLDDPQFSIVFQAKKQLFCRTWIDDATGTLKVGFARLKDLLQNGRREDADFIHAVAGALKIVGELNIAYTVLNDEPANNIESSTAQKA